MMDLRQLARRLGGEVSNGQVLCPGPNHSPKDRSLAVRPSWQSPDGFIYHSHAGDDWRACAEHVRARLGLQHEPRQRVAEKRTTTPPAQDNKTSSRDLARRLVAESIDPRDTVAERYIGVERGLPGVLDDVTAQTLKFHPRCAFRDDGKLSYSPALICAVRSLRMVLGAAQALGELEAVEKAILRDPALVTAVQRIRLDDKGRKVERKSLGVLGDDGCVLCCSIWDLFYGSHATIAEGVETSLSMRALGFEGCVALAGAGRFKTFDPPFTITNLTISAENDAGASETAWRAAGERWATEGRTVEVIAPPPTAKDANDLILQGEERAA